MFLNLAAYLFTDLQDLPALRRTMQERGRELDLRGTVLLAPEGINLCLSGPAADARAFARFLREDERLAGLEFKESRSRSHSFNRFLVKLKKEIITFGRPSFRPASGRAAAVAPATLARWLDRGRDDEDRPVVMVDTRNGFEVEVGRFAGAVDPGLGSFTELPEAMRRHRPALAGKRVVTYCTGGIRCEKAALHLASEGIDHIVQLDGGVLKNFEEIGGRHWEGELYVFDRRVSLTPDLRPGSWSQDYPSRRIRPEHRKAGT
jgi:UPF0176 protein